jgi:hypothetical protein
MDAFADPELRLRALVVLFAGTAGIRLILAGVSQPTRCWSLIVVGLLVFMILARPDVLGRAPPTIFHAAPAAVHDAVSAP